MTDSRAVVCGLYRNEATLEYAICHLRNVGFLDQNFSVIFPASNRDVRIESPLCSGSPGDAENLFRTVWTQEILLSVQCESSGQAVIARKILQSTDADTVVSSGESSANIQFSAERFSDLA
jgi:hypothetical protein